MAHPLTRAKSLALLRRLAEQAQHAHARPTPEHAELNRQLLALRIYRDGDSVALASAIAEQTARTKLADQALTKSVAVRARRAEAERSTR